MANKYTYKQIKEHIRGKAALKLAGTDESTFEGKAIKTFLKLFFTEYNNTMNTIYVSNGSKQTDRGKRRTIEDIYRITCYYYPKAKMSTVYAALIDLINEGIVVSALCSVIHKRVYRKNNGNYDGDGFFNSGMTDEYGFDFSACNFKTSLLNNKKGWGSGYSTANLNMVEL